MSYNSSDFRTSTVQCATYQEHDVISFINMEENPLDQIKALLYKLSSNVT